MQNSSHHKPRDGGKPVGLSSETQSSDSEKKRGGPVMPLPAKSKPEPKPRVDPVPSRNLKECVFALLRAKNMQKLENSIKVARQTLRWLLKLLREMHRVVKCVSKLIAGTLNAKKLYASCCKGRSSAILAVSFFSPLSYPPSSRVIR